MNDTKQFYRLTGCCIMFASLMLFSGCGEAYRGDADLMMQAYRGHDLPTALAVVQRRSGPDGQEQLSNDPDHLIWRLEQGVLLRTMGDFAASEEAFEYADWAIDVFDEEPEVRLTSEFAATLTNLASLPYRGYAYDRIMLSTYRALNMLKLGDREIARIELNRALVRQQEAIERNEQRIAAAEEEAQQAKEEGLIDERSTQSKELDALGEFDILYAEVYQAQGNYVNPFTDFLQGLYYLYAGRTADDLENGRHAMMRVAAMIGADNPFIADDLAVAESITAGGATPEITYVIFETGLAPSRTEERITIPVPVRGVGHVTAAFPKLVFHDDHEPHLLVHHSDGTLHTAHLADLDTIVGLEFRNELPIVMSRTIQIAAAQAAASYGVQQATGRDAIAGALTGALGGAYRTTQARADMRTWRTLPKQVQYARFTTPEDRQLKLQTASGQIQSIAIEPGQVNVIYAKSATRGGPLNMWQLRLR